MTSIHLTLTGCVATAKMTGILTSGMVGVPVTISCDSSWKGLTKTLVCRGCGEIKSVLGVGEQAVVAPEVLRLTDKNRHDLFLGVEGRSADGRLVIPSTFAYCGLIYPGATADADPSVDPPNPPWAQILCRIGRLQQLKTHNKEDLVAAINELAEQEPPQDGYTPLKGVDYWTQTDKEQMVADVLAALSAYDGGLRVETVTVNGTTIDGVTVDGAAVQRIFVKGAVE